MEGAVFGTGGVSSSAEALSTADVGAAAAGGANAFDQNRELLQKLRNMSSEMDLSTMASGSRHGALEEEEKSAEAGVLRQLQARI